MNAYRLEHTKYIITVHVIMNEFIARVLEVYWGRGEGWVTRGGGGGYVQTRSMAASSSLPMYLKGILCLIMSEKYSFASLDVEVPKPTTTTTFKHKDTLLRTRDRCSSQV